MTIPAIVRKTTFVLVFIFIAMHAKGMGAPAVAGAPPAGAPPAGNGTPCWAPPCIPIDGGITILLAGALIFGTHKIIRSSKED